MTNQPLPEFDWMPVPAGVVTLETGRAFEVPAFAIARLPVTNADYERFIVAENGYARAEWWDFSDDARAFHADSPTPPHTAHEGADLPRTNVSWYEAVAFARWLGTQLGMRVSLPTEQQWQRAAQGDDRRRYPWGNDFDATRCNFNTQGPTPVGQFPTGASPCGALDMAGNVWEWCLNDYYSGSADISLSASDRVLRGGSWWCNTPTDLTVDYRSGGFLHGWSHDWGFRVALLEA